MSNQVVLTNSEKLADLEDLKFSVESALESAMAANDSTGWLNNVQKCLDEALQGVKGAIEKIQPLADKEESEERRAMDREYLNDRI